MNQWEGGIQQCIADAFALKRGEILSWKKKSKYIYSFLTIERKSSIYKAQYLTYDTHKKYEMILRDISSYSSF